MNKILEKNYLLIEKKSKFYCYILELTDEKNFVKMKEAIAKEHSKATHIVYAYRINSENSLLIEKAFNAKEPQNTASKPLLKALRLKNATNIAIFVARYYGGIKLGVGLLCRSYFNVSIKSLEAFKFKNF